MRTQVSKMIVKQIQLILLLTSVSEITKADANAETTASTVISSPIIIEPPVKPDPDGEESKDEACDRMARGYRKILALQDELVLATPDKTGDLGKALQSAEDAKLQIDEGRKFRGCEKLNHMDTAAEFVSIRRESDLTEINRCPHRFYSYRATADALSVLDHASPIFDGHRVDAIKDLKMIKALIESDMDATKYCEGKPVSVDPPLPINPPAPIKPMPVPEGVTYH